MRVIWLQPWAWIGLAALAAPVLIHLLARHRQRELAFPSLRFVRATQSAAPERRAISDVPLLIVRLLILTVAVAALAAPVFVSAARQRAWSTRTARAIVVVETPSAADRDAMRTLVESERASAFVSEAFTASARVAGAIEDGVSWLNRQPPAARELVVVGDLRAGAIVAADLARIPATTGIRVLPIAAAEPSRTAELVAIAETHGRTSAESLVATLDDDQTRVKRAASARSMADLVTVRAAPGEEAIATAARDAVLAEGVRLPREGDRRLEIGFAGAAASDVTKPPSAAWMRATLARLDGLTGGERDGRLVVRAPVRATDAAAVHVVDRVVRAAWSDPLDALEPRRIPAATLAAWSRGASGAPLETTPGDEGDARWLWLLVLALLALEAWLRRPAPGAVAAAPPSESEARIA